MNPRPITVPISTLVLDFSVYPRHRLDTQNVRVLRDAYQAGEELPPIDIDKKSRRVVDGFHRVRMLEREDPNSTILAHEHEYANDADLFLDAVRRNARHGVRLTPYDRARCLEQASELGIDETAIAGALALSVDMTAEIRAARTAFTPEGKPTHIKRSLRHLAGTTLTQRQVDANEKSSGWPARFHAEQLALLIAADAVDWEDESTGVALRHLHETLTTKFTTSV